MSSLFDYSLGMELRFDHVIKRFGEKTAVDIPSLVIRSGERFTFVGPSGAGKSTVMRLIAGSDTPSEGALTLGDRPLCDVVATDPDHGVSVVTPATLLEPGQRPFAICDEPLGGVDAVERADRIAAIKTFYSDQDRGFLYATEHQAEALELSQRIAVLNAGRVQQVGSPDAMVNQPANTFVATFFGRPEMNVVAGILQKDGVAVEIGPRSIQLTGMVAQTFARDVFLGIRPEHVRLSEVGASGWKATVSAVTSVEMGKAVEVTVDMGVFVSLEGGDASYRVGQVVSLALPARHLHVFDERGGRLDVV